MPWLHRLIRLYPRAWRERYAAEFADLIDSLRADGRGRVWLAWHVATGAADAHLREGHAGVLFRDPGVRRGVRDGLVLAAIASVLVVVTNLGFPDRGDDDPASVTLILATYLIVAVWLVLVGGRAAQLSRHTWGAVAAGAAAAVVFAFVVLAAFAVVDNVFFDVVSRQPGRLEHFARSGETSMRAFINWGLATGALVAAPMAACFGGALGALGGLLLGPGHRQRLRQ